MRSINSQRMSTLPAVGLDSLQARRPRASEVERHVIVLGARVRRHCSVLCAIAVEAFMNDPGK
jgi:hypothetical protein